MYEIFGKWEEEAENTNSAREIIDKQPYAV